MHILFYFLNYIKMKKTHLLVVGVIVTSLVLLGSTFAFRGEGHIDNEGYKKNSEFMELLKNKDYEKFKTLFEWKELLKTIDTQAKFDKFIQMKEAAMNHDMDTAKKLSD